VLRQQTDYLVFYPKGRKRKKEKKKKKKKTQFFKLYMKHCFLLIAGL